MKRVVIFVGSARRQLTYYAASRFSDNLQSLGDVECEIVTLSNYQLGTCRGCKLCFDKGEEYCPLKDDRDELIGKIMASDGVVIATPNYSFQVSAITKIFSIGSASSFIDRASSARPSRASSPRASSEGAGSCAI